MIGSNGKSTIVCGVYPRGKRQTYRVEFDDGFGAEVSDDHLWKVTEEFSKTSHVLSTVSLKALLSKNKYQFRIPVVSPVCYEFNSSLCLDPYLLGLFIGSGVWSHEIAVLNLPSEKILEISRKLENCKLRLEKCALEIFVEKSATPEVVSLLKSREIPEIYMRSSIENRLQILRGIFDVHAEPHQGNVFCRIHKSWTQLTISLIIELIQSLGGIAIHDVVTNQIIATFLKTTCPFSIQSLVCKYGCMIPITPTRLLKSISACRETDVMCISVEADDHLYVTEHFIVTHNTIQVISIFLINNANRQYHFWPIWPHIVDYGDRI